MRWLKRISKWLGIGLLALIVAGAVYQQIGLARDAGLAPPANEMVDVGGRAMHLVCMGSGARTFVLDAGLGAGAFEWYRLQPQLAKWGRVCAFDRAGLGWSDGADGRHDADAAADQLNALVHAAHVATPFVYVGHSLGANFAIVYRARHPDDVAALVLSEPGDPKDLLEDFHGTREEAMAASECAIGCYAGVTAAYIGVPRLAAAILGAGEKNLSGRALSDYRAAIGRPSATYTALASLGALPRTAYEQMDVTTLDATPTLVLASTEARAPEGDETPADVVKWRAGYDAYLARLAAMSRHGTGPVAISSSNHASMVMGEAQAAFAAKAIADFLAKNNVP